MVKKWLAFWLGALAILLALIPQQAHACSCVVPGPPADELAESSAVFAGKVTNLHYPYSNGSSIDPVLVTFDVSQVWKGPTWQRVIIHTVWSGASCGYGFYPDQEYIVYAIEWQGHLHVSLCSRTRLLANAGEDLSALGEGVVPAGQQQSDNRIFLPIALR